jgi:hypothetical protein
MKVKLATAFAAGFLVAVILGLLTPASRSLCRTGDMTIGIGAERAQELEAFAGGWIHNARECRLGDYLVIAPDRRGSPDILLSRMGELFLGVSKNSTMLLDADGQRVLYQWDRGKSPTISYAGYDTARQAWIDNRDFGADGVVDFRTTEISGQQAKQELKIGDRWLEFLKRDGTTGVLLDGKFISVDDARKKLAAAGGSVQ